MSKFKYGSICITSSKYLLLDWDDAVRLTSEGWFPEYEWTGKFYVSYLRRYTSPERIYAHDWVAGLMGKIPGRDYEYISFNETYSSLPPAEVENYLIMDKGPIRERAGLDCRRANLIFVTKKDVKEELTTKFKGVYWESEKKRWRSYLNNIETGRTQEKLARFYTDVAAAHHRDIVLLERGIAEPGLNFPRETYDNQFGQLTSSEDVKDFRCTVTWSSRFNKFVGGVFEGKDPTPLTPTPGKVSLYSTSEEVKEVCEQFIKNKWGKFAFAFFREAEKHDTKKLSRLCPKCGKKLPIGLMNNFVLTCASGMLFVCEECFDKNEESDMPNPVSLTAMPNPLTNHYKVCVSCNQHKPDTEEYYPKYKYKGEIKLEPTCIVCKKLRDKQRYLAKKGNKNG